MRDFTIRSYEGLVDALRTVYTIVDVRSFLVGAHGNNVGTACLRHDVDRRAEGALPCAEICRELGVSATFYFRHPYTFDRSVLRRVAELGHEVGYHYETLTKTRGDVPRAVMLFERELREFRAVVDVDTACMHGSPLSRWDNRDIWKATSPAVYALAGEPYLSLTPDVGYLTDTGRGWNRRSASLRDAMPGPMPSFESTFDLIRAIEAGSLPDRLMINIHPERWNDGLVPWAVELVGQTAKNQVKSVLRRARNARA